MHDFEPLRWNLLVRVLDDLARSNVREISAIHLHRTWHPTTTQFVLLAERFGSDVAAGRKLCHRVRCVNMEKYGWHDIAQHITVDPVGAPWTCRR